MVSLLVKFATPVAAVAILYRLLVADIIAFVGPWRVIQRLSDFPAYSCRRVQHPNSEGCEDMWIDDEARLLYAACLGSVARQHWSPT